MLSVEMESSLASFSAFTSELATSFSPRQGPGAHRGPSFRRVLRDAPGFSIEWSAECFPQNAMT